MNLPWNLRNNNIIGNEMKSQMIRGMNVIRDLLPCIILALLVAGCSASRQAGTTPDPPETMIGTVRFINLEGGFFAIIADDETRYDPLNLPLEFHQDGLRIKFSGQPDVKAVSVHMWGVLIRLDSISRID